VALAGAVALALVAIALVVLACGLLMGVAMACCSGSPVPGGGFIAALLFACAACASLLACASYARAFPLSRHAGWTIVTAILFGTPFVVGGILSVAALVAAGRGGAW
jgi:hypothetical protein